jgi:hypothetical protein
MGPRSAARGGTQLNKRRDKNKISKLLTCAVLLGHCGSALEWDTIVIVNQRQIQIRRESKLKNIYKMLLGFDYCKYPR